MNASPPTTSDIATVMSHAAALKVDDFPAYVALQLIATCGVPPHETDLVNWSDIEEVRASTGVSSFFIQLP
jgi:hypothetical protein